MSLTNGYVQCTAGRELQQFSWNLMAFDRVWHDEPLCKLGFCALSSKSLAWLQSFSSQRTLSALVGSDRSTPFPVTARVPQSSHIGPVLFLVFINGLPACVTNSKLLCRHKQVKGKLHSKIISSDMIRFFSVEPDGEGPRSKFEREDGQTDGGKLARARICDVMVPHWCHLAIIARSRDWIKIFVISRNQPASSDDMMLTRRWLRSSSRSSSWCSPVTMLRTLTRCHRKFS